MIWKYLLFVLGIVVIVASFIKPAPQQIIGDASRIFYYHIPMAWIAVVSYSVNLVFSIRYLKTRNNFDDFRAQWAAELGTVFCLLATITGAIFAKVTWGVYWNWGEPRMLSIFILLLIYGAYLSLRSTINDLERKGLLSAVYAIVAFPTVPFFMFVMPRMMKSLHPADSIVDDNLKIQMNGEVLSIFLLALLLFSLLYYWVYRLGTRIYKIELKNYEENE